MKKIILSIAFLLAVLSTCVSAHAAEQSTDVNAYFSYIESKFAEVFGENASVEFSSEAENVIDVRIWNQSFAYVPYTYDTNDIVKQGYNSQKEKMEKMNATLYDALSSINENYHLIFSARSSNKDDDVIFAYYDGKCIYDKVQGVFLGEYNDVLETVGVEMNSEYLKSLEKRIAALEAIISGKPTQEPSTEVTSSAPLILSGIYIVGEDIEPGSYSLNVLEGESTGTITLFSSYESYMEYSGNKYLAIYYEDLRSPDYTKETDYKNWDDYFNGFSTSVSNINLRKGMCMAITGVKVEAIKK